MKKLKNFINYFSRKELILWLSSLLFITVSFFIFDREGILPLAASLIGATALILCAKGNPLGQLLIIVFSCLYGIISYSCAYYGEMITYLGMSAPMALLALISWMRNPYNESGSEVKVNKISAKEIPLIVILSATVTAAFYFILDTLGTANLIPSTVSVTTSFVAVYLTFRRSPYYAAAYAANDLVLIVLWTMATFSDISYLSVLICFITFLANDIYGFFNWLKMRNRQSNSAGE